MGVTAASISALVESELAGLVDQRVIAHIRSLLVPPEVQMRVWDYGVAGNAYPCWLVVSHKPSNTGIAYCEFGFGPSSPWGLLFLNGTDPMSMGMDSSWFERFLDAYFDSLPSTDLPIWRVFQHQGTDFPGTAITAEGTWDATWKVVNRLRSEQTAFRYDCYQSVYVRDP